MLRRNVNALIYWLSGNAAYDILEYNDLSGEGVPPHITRRILATTHALCAFNS